MARPLYPRKKKSPEEPEAPLWQNPYLVLSGVSIFALIGVACYHFIIAPSTISDRTGATEKTGLFSFFGHTMFSKNQPLDLGNEEMESLGISSSSRKAFAGVHAENYREMRRLASMQKYEGIRLQCDERRQMLADAALKRNNGVGVEFKAAIAALQETDNLGIMKLENLLQSETAKGDMSSEKLDVIIYAYQTLGETYTKKQMKEKAKSSYLNMLRLMKERAPQEQEAQFSEAVAKVEELRVTTAPGN
ncbi:MAG: hypothetical protein HQM09_11700 [Candidatus Riflebacteria bacterium]|nr:hypothetical protein [Candidatus Riflebacteria bacterium]